MTSDDPIWSDGFHVIAFRAFVDQAREEGGWPDPEKTRQRAYAMFEAEKRAPGKTQPDD